MSNMLTASLLVYLFGLIFIKSLYVFPFPSPALNNSTPPATADTPQAS